MLTILDEGVPLAANTTGIDFVGAGVTASGSGPTKTVTIPGASSPLTTKGDLYGFTTVDARVGVGADGAVLTADSAATPGVSWQPQSVLPALTQGFSRYTLANTAGVNILTGLTSTGANAGSGTISLSSRIAQCPRSIITIPAALNSKAWTTFYATDAERIFYRGGSAGLGGFKIRYVFGIETTQTNMVYMVGYGSWSVFASPSSALVPSNQTEAIFAGCDVGDTNIQIMHNDGAGTCTKVDTGFNARTAGDMFILDIACTPNGSSFSVSLKKLGSTTFTTTPSSNLPTATTGGGAFIFGNSGSGAGMAGTAILATFFVGVDTPSYLT